MNATTDGRHPVDDLAAYAVNALDPGQHATIEQHLARCPRCRAQLDDYLDTLAALTPDEGPPPQLWARISAEVTATRHTGRRTTPAQAAPTAATHPPAHAAPARPGRHRQCRRRDPARTRATAVLAAAAVALAVAAMAGIGQLRTDDNGRPATAAELAQAALEDADSTVVALNSLDDGTPVARLVIDATGDAYVVFDDLAPLPSDQAYQLWRTEGTTPVSLGVLGTATTGAAQVTLPAGDARLAISQEPAGGSPTPTGPLVAAGTLTT